MPVVAPSPKPAPSQYSFFSIGDTGHLTSISSHIVAGRTLPPPPVLPRADVHQRWRPAHPTGPLGFADSGLHHSHLTPEHAVRRITAAVQLSVVVTPAAFVILWPALLQFSSRGRSTPQSGRRPAHRSVSANPAVAADGWRWHELGYRGHVPQ